MIDRKRLGLPTITFIIAFILSIWMLVLLRDIQRDVNLLGQKLDKIEWRLDGIEREVEIGNTIKEGGKYQW